MVNAKDDLGNYLNSFIAKDNEQLNMEQKKQSDNEKERETLVNIGIAILDPNVENSEQFSLINNYLSKKFTSDEVNKYIRVIIASSRLKAIANSDKKPQSKTIHDMIEVIIDKLDSDKKNIEDELGINQKEIDRYLDEIQQSTDFVNIFLDENSGIKKYTSDNLVNLVSFLKSISTNEELDEIYQMIIPVIESGIELSKNKNLSSSSYEIDDMIDVEDELEKKVQIEEVHDEATIDSPSLIAESNSSEVIATADEPEQNIQLQEVSDDEEIIDIEDEIEAPSLVVPENEPEVIAVLDEPEKNVQVQQIADEVANDEEIIDVEDAISAPSVVVSEEETETIDIDENQLNTKAITEIVDDIYSEKQSSLDFSKIPNITIASLYNSTSPEVRKLIYSSTEEELKWDVMLYDWINNLKPNISNDDAISVAEDIINTYENDYLYLPQSILSTYLENKQEYDEEVSHLSEQEMDYLQQINTYLEQDNYDLANMVTQYLPVDGIIRSFVTIPKKYNEYENAKETYQRVRELYLENGDSSIYKAAKKELSERRNELVGTMNEFSSNKSITNQNLVLGKVA